MESTDLFPMSDHEKELLAKEDAAYGYRLPEWKWMPGDGMCYACGDANKSGLHLHFFEIPKGCLSFFTPSHEHQSYDDRMHGGLISTLLDEVTGNYLFFTEKRPAYTGKMEIRFRSPVMIGETVKIEGREVKRKGPLVVMEGKIFHEDGSVAAECVSHMMVELSEKGSLPWQKLKLLKR